MPIINETFPVLAESDRRIQSQIPSIFIMVGKCTLDLTVYKNHSQKVAFYNIRICSFMCNFGYFLREHSSKMKIASKVFY